MGETWAHEGGPLIKLREGWVSLIKTTGKAG